MNIVSFIQGLFLNPLSLSPLFLLELIGFTTGILAVFLIAKERILGWPIGIVTCLVYAYVFWQGGLISDAILYTIFIPLQIYGWVDWHLNRGKEKGEIPVQRLSQKGVWFWMFFGTAASVVWALGLMSLAKHAEWMPNPALPYHDAATTVFSLIAQYLMARRFLACWLIWIGVDILSPMNYLDRGFYPTAVLYFVYLGLAIVGYFQWKSTLEKQEAAA